MPSRRVRFGVEVFMRALPAIALCMFTLGAIPSASEACSCVQSGPPCQATWQAGAVFTGKVTSIGDAPKLQGDLAFAGARLVTFQVAEPFRGVAAAMLSVRTGTGGGDCGYAFQQGQSYLVYAHQMPNGEFSTGICSRTRRLDEAGDDLAYLRSFSSKPAFTGRVLALAKFYAATSKGEWTAPPRAFEGAKLQLRGADGVVRTATSSRDGDVEIAVPAGTYDVSVEVPAGLYAEFYPAKAEVRDVRGCGHIDVYVKYDGRVAGRVVSTDGAPVPHLTVELGEPDEPEPFRFGGRFQARTDAAGQFEFTRVPPGEFLIALGVDRDDRRQFIARPAFYPGVTSSAEAKIVTLTASGVIHVGDFTLPESVAYVTITGIALEADGSPASGAKIYVKPSSKDFRLIGQPAVAGLDGKFAIALPATGKYVLMAERMTGRQDVRFTKSDDVEISAGDASGNLTIRMRPIR